MSYFKPSELTQPAGYGLPAEPIPAEWLVDETRWPALERVLNAIRQHVGKPVFVTPRGGYRSEEFNRRLYAARGQKPTDSQHSQARAADIYTHVMSPTELHTLILELYNEGLLPELGGLGIYDSFVHVDVRPTPPGKKKRLARWDYRSKGKK